MGFRDKLIKTATKVNPAQFRADKLRSLLRVQASQGDFEYKMERSVMKLYLECDGDYIKDHVLPLIESDGITVEEPDPKHYLFSWRPE